MKIIEKIEIRHFRSIFDQDLITLNHLNIFGGQNDTGKSNVLKALNLFFNNQTSFLEEFSFFSDFSMQSKAKSRESKKGRQYISIKIFFDSSELKGKNALKKLASENGGLWVERRWWAYNGDGLYEQSIPVYIDSAKQGIKRSFSVFLQSIKFVYIPAFKNEDVFSYVLNLSAENKGLFLDKNAKNELDKNIASATSEFSKDFSDITNIKTLVTLPIVLESFWSSLEVNSQFEGTPAVFKRGSKSDYQIRFTSRGEGIKSLFIPVILGWLSRSSRGNYWIWGIDEPENSLEAIKAEQLFNKFTDYSKHAQIFVSSHSPSFIFPQNEYDGSNVYIATQNNPGETEFKTIDDSSRELELMFGYDYGSFLNLQKEHAEKLDELNETKKEIKQIKEDVDRAILFVEGKTDKEIIENAWKKIFPRKKKNFRIIPKENAASVSYALENSDVFQKDILFGLFDFDREGYSRWNGLRPKGYKDISSAPDDCLVLKKKGKKHYALLLPVPARLHSQVINPKTGVHFGDGSKLFIELMFYGVLSLDMYFQEQDGPGGAKVIEFVGKNKITFAKETKGLTVLDFENFKPLFEKINKLLNT